MTATTVAAFGCTAAQAAGLPLGRLLSRAQALLWLGCADEDLDQAVGEGRVLAVQYADAPARYPQCQFDRRRCQPEQITLAQAAFAHLDRSGVLAACWLASSEPVLDLTWQRSRITVVNDDGWPTITVQAL